MFEMFMMVTNGSMCIMSGASFLKSMYDNYMHHTSPNQPHDAEPQHVTDIKSGPPKLVHHASGCMHHNDSKKIASHNPEPKHYIIQEVDLSGEHGNVNNEEGDFSA